MFVLVRRPIFILFLIAALYAHIQADVPWLGGGTADDPYLIYNADDLQAVGGDPNYWGAHFKLMADIDMSDYSGTQYNIIGNDIYKPFTGVFDGNSCRIYHFSYSTDVEAATIGLFGYVDDLSAEIKNLSLVDPNISCSHVFSSCGSIAGNMISGSIINCSVENCTILGGCSTGTLVGLSDGQIVNCHVSGKVTSNNFGGGLVGDNSGLVSYCGFAGSVSGNSYVGGLIGGSSGGNMGIIQNCFSEASVQGYYGVGGLVGGLIAGGQILDCYFEGEVSGETEIGGLVGTAYFSPYITRSYSDANVSGVDDVGGLAGYITGTAGKYFENYTIESSYSSGLVSATGKGVGGFVGRVSGTFVINNCYSTAEVIGNDYVGGFAGSVYGEKVGICYSQPAIFNCYSAGSVVGDSNVGGFSGFKEQTYALSCYWDIQTTRQQTSANGIGLTTQQMHDSNSFSGWGCQQVWTIGEGDYPRLVWENKPGQPIQKFMYGGGSGELNDPYLIYTAYQFAQIAHNWCDRDKNFKLGADIDLQDYADRLFPIGQDIFYEATGYGPFCGVFDGNGHKISNFVFESDEFDYVGLFGLVVGPNSLIKDVTLVGPIVQTERKHAGLLVGELDRGEVRNCLIEGGNITGNWDVGGLVGTNKGIIQNCGSKSFVNGLCDVGGLVGANTGPISNCFSDSVVAGDSDVGGLVGWDLVWDFGYIYNSYARGKVSGRFDKIGGLTGTEFFGIVSNCYSTAIVEGPNNIGGLVGYHASGDYLSCFWDIDVNPDVNGIGNVEREGVFGLTTQNMQIASTYINAGWDFVGENINGTEDIWAVCEGTNYPRLTWSILKVDYVCPDGINFLDFAFFAKNWLEEDCSHFNNCDETDLDLSGSVDTSDLQILIDYWLEGG